MLKTLLEVNLQRQFQTEVAAQIRVGKKVRRKYRCTKKKKDLT